MVHRSRPPTPQFLSGDCIVQRQRSSKSHRRSGSMLVQVVVLIGLVSSVMSISGVVLFRLLHEQTKTSQLTGQTAIHLRIARDFRADAHAAQSVKPIAGNSEVVFITPTDTITWVATPDKLTRTARGINQSDTTTPSDVFHIANTVAHFELTAADSAASRVRLILANQENGQTKNHTPLIIDGAVSLNHRFSAK